MFPFDEGVGLRKTGTRVLRERVSAGRKQKYSEDSVVASLSSVYSHVIVSGLPQLRNAIHLLSIDMFLPYPSNSSLYATRQHHSVRTRCAMRNFRAEKGTRHVSQGARLGVIQTTKASNNPPRVVRWPATVKKDARPRIAFASRRRDNSTSLILQTNVTSVPA
jgi:hypothetical protein